MNALFATDAKFEAVSDKPAGTYHHRSANRCGAVTAGPQREPERIKNLEADTDLKLQSLRHANIQLAIAILAVLGTVFGVLVGAVTLYLDYRQPPKPPPTFIFLSPTQNTAL